MSDKQLIKKPRITELSKKPSNQWEMVAYNAVSINYY